MDQDICEADPGVTKIKTHMQVVEGLEQGDGDWSKLRWYLSILRRYKHVTGQDSMQAWGLERRPSMQEPQSKRPSSRATPGETVRAHPSQVPSR